MRTAVMIGLVVAFGVLAGVGLAGADSIVDYPDSSSSYAFNLGGGVLAFAFVDHAGDSDIFIHGVNTFANLAVVGLAGFSGFALWLDFEGFNQGFAQYGVYTCVSQVGQVCTVSGIRRGTLFL